MNASASANRCGCAVGKSVGDDKPPNPVALRACRRPESPGGSLSTPIRQNYKRYPDYREHVSFVTFLASFSFSLFVPVLLSEIRQIEL